MNILFVKHFFMGFMVSEIPRVSVFGHCIRLLSPTYIQQLILLVHIYIYI